MTKSRMTEVKLLSKPKSRAAHGSIQVWLRWSVLVALLATASSIIGIVFEDAVYGGETANWAAQAVGQDVTNLLAFPTLLAAAFAASRGSVRGYLVWLGLLVYSAYTYAIYAFAVHFGSLFLLWVAILGLSAYSLVGGLMALDPDRLRSAFTGATRNRFASRLLIGIGSVFGAMWLSEVVPAMLANEAPAALQEVGLLSNPVHVLDLAFFLPALILGGALLAKGRPWGYVLAPVLLTATVFLAVGIVSLMLVSAARDLVVEPGVVIAVGTLGVVETVTAVRMLRRFGKHLTTGDVLRPRGVPTESTRQSDHAPVGRPATGIPA